jgi:CMP-N-acetylneuraminic acid synthetase
MFLVINGQKLLAVIPARAGSKRLPSKNIRPMAGKPLIWWSISESLKSKYVDEVLVSTDDSAIASMAEEYGACVPFIRPADLADDNSRSIDVVIHAIDELKDKGSEFEYVVLLQPTSPLRTARHIDEAVTLYLEKQASAVVSVTELEHPVEWAGVVPDDLSMDDFLKNKSNRRSQDFPIRYRMNGAIYLISIAELRRGLSFLPETGCYAYKMERESSIDIDDILDFQIAEFFAQSFIPEVK